MSTDREEQLSSYENQLRYYKSYIKGNPLYEFAGIYADEGITGTNTKKREEFNRMIADCKAGKIDRIITKSISRFARNTLDCLNYVRELKAIGVGITFEKENIDTLDSKGEVLLTILSSLAQDESRSISENSQWGVRKRYEAGEFKMATKRFMGFDADSNGKLIVNKQQAEVVKRIYAEYLSGKTTAYIERIFEKEGVINWNGKAEWQKSTIESILKNEKYKGDALLQKTYTADFLTKKRIRNDGYLEQFYIKGDHEAIIDVDTWEAVQLEIKRRDEYLKKYKLKAYSHNTENNPFSSRVICGECGRAFVRRGWQNRNGETRRIWQCSERYKIKGVEGCGSSHIDEHTLIKAFDLGWQAVCKSDKEKWYKQLESDNPLTRYRASDFLRLVEENTKINADLMLRVLERIEVGKVIKIIFLDGTVVELPTS